MSEDGANLVALRPANSPNGFDLRRIGANPDHWYPVAWSDELKVGRALGRRFAGEPIVIYRGKSGQVFALEDRCAHRQVPLHLGVVSGDELKCHYHGWTYNCAGKCVGVPYFGNDRLPNGVKSYPAREVDGLIFVFPGDPALAEARLPQSLGSARKKTYKTRRLNREVACHYTFMHENLFDMNHQFMHRKQMGSIRARCLGKSHGDNWAQVEYSFSRTGGKSSVGEQVIVDLMRKRGEAKKDFSDYMRIRTDYPNQSLKVWVGRDIKPEEEPVLDVWLGYTPLDAEQRTNRTYGYLSVKKPGVPVLIHAVWPFVTWFTENIFREDKEIVEFEQRAYDAQGTDWNNEVFPPLRDLRSVLARCGRPMDPLNTQPAFASDAPTRPRRIVRGHAWDRVRAAAFLLMAVGGGARADEVPAPDAGGGSPAQSTGALSHWLDPSTAPFIPVPLIGTDPNSGTTLGLLPVWLSTNDDHEISRILAPDILHNPYFGWGVDARIYEYTSRDSQWSIDSGIKERVERGVDGEYQVGRLRDDRWSINYSLIYNRSGTPRFYGVGNESPEINETNYTNTQELAQVQVGLNLTHDWQILYTARYLVDDVTPGTLSGIESIETRFGQVLGVGTSEQMLNRLSVIYDTRDDIVVPSRGVEMVAYGGEAARGGLFNDSMYSEAGIDGRNYWPVAADTVIATHVALRYMPSSHEVPFWALSSLGGGTSVIGGEQPLRGFGEGRFYDRNSFSSSLELRRNVWSFDAVSTRVDLEMAPFVDLGRVFARTSADPIEQLHHVFGVGFRGIAKPFVVGKVDIGYGSEGVAIFTGLNYPF